MKIVGDQSEAIHTILHFPVSLSGVYDRAAVEIMKRIRGSLMRSVHLARLMRSGIEDTLAEAALVERSRCAAFVVEGDRSIRDANQRAVQLFSAGQAIQVRNHRCMLGDATADARFGRTVNQLSKGLPTNETRIVYRKGADALQVVMAAVPPPPGAVGPLSLLPPRRLVLVLIMELAVGQSAPSHFSDLTPAFGLTPAEVRFCGELFLGKPIAEIADHIGISIETARSHMKAILQKTGSSRQSQLMLLLSKLQ
jgi:DNA-binding CsgD family transcriptional regulator